jgi:hypothetical protein
MLHPGAAAAASLPLWLLLLRAPALPPQSNGGHIPPRQDLALARQPLAHTAAGHVASLLINGERSKQHYKACEWSCCRFASIGH